MIWLIGGTRESREIAQILSNLKIDYLVTVTTVEACSMYPETLIKIGKLSADDIVNLCDKYKIKAIVDASHPYAEIISKQAIEYALFKDIPYLRYERPCLEVSTTSSQRLKVESVDTLISKDYLEGQRVLLTLGYKSLPKFKNWQEKATLFTRILPALNSLQIALDAGFTADRIIAMRPPISRELERALWKEWKITTVVTKANGFEGGEAIKQQLTEELNIQLIVIMRPEIIYPRSTNKLEDIISFCQIKDSLKIEYYLRPQ